MNKTGEHEKLCQDIRHILRRRYGTRGMTASDVYSSLIRTGQWPLLTTNKVRYWLEKMAKADRIGYEKKGALNIRYHALGIGEGRRVI